MNSVSGKGVLRLGVKILLLIIVIVAATWVAHYIRDTLNLEIMPRNEQGVHTAIMFGTIAYVLLLALPFVPGAEIGIALLTSFGSSIAPLVYAATVVAMMLAYVIGMILPTSILCRFFRFFRLRKAAELIERAAVLAPQDRIQLLRDATPPKYMALILKYPYVALALAVNIPGNALIGGGGGIMLMAGLSGLFAPFWTFIAIVIGVSPVPAAIFFFGG